MKRLVYQALLAALLLIVGTAANAQYDEPTFDVTQPRWNVHIGAAFPMGNAANTAEFIVGLGYETPVDEEGTWLGLSLDYIPVTTFGDEFFDDDDDTVSLVPLLLYVKGMGILNDYRVWGALGVGTSWASDDIPELRIDDGFNFAWTAQLGIDFTPQFFGQTRYIAGSTPGDDAFLTAELGWRF